jgi:hypothetical protein
MPQFDPRKAETPKTSHSTVNPQAPKFLDQVANACRLKRFSYRTEQAYVSWAKRFILFHNRRHPNEMGEQEIEAFLTHLARNRGVAASTQNQALNASMTEHWSPSSARLGEEIQAARK